MKELEQRFVSWVGASVATLDPLESADVHLDAWCSQPAGSGRSRGAVDVGLHLLDWAARARPPSVVGYLLMLMVPLGPSAGFTREAPNWTALDFGSTPPSLYIMRPLAFLQRDPSERYLARIDSPLDSPEVTAYFQCWRRPEDPAEDGWERDVRVVSTALLRG